MEAQLESVIAAVTCSRTQEELLWLSSSYKNETGKFLLVRLLMQPKLHESERDTVNYSVSFLVVFVGSLCVKSRMCVRRVFPVNCCASANVCLFQRILQQVCENQVCGRGSVSDSLNTM